MIRKINLLQYYHSGFIPSSCFWSSFHKSADSELSAVHIFCCSLSCYIDPTTVYDGRHIDTFPAIKTSVKGGVVYDVHHFLSHVSANRGEYFLSLIKTDFTE